MSNNSSVCFIFVIDPPALCLEATLLVASCRRHLPDVDLIAYCPEHKIDLVPPQLREYFAANGTDLVAMPTEGVFSPPYKQGNKLLAAAHPRPHEFSVFLDTDVVVWQPFDVGMLAVPDTICAAAEGRSTWGTPPGHWEKAYGVFGLDVPEEHIMLARTRKPSRPYFNAGVVGFPTRFAKVWLETALELDRPEHEMPQRRPWLDQIALPVALRREGMAYQVLDDRFNLSLSRQMMEPETPEGARKSIEREANRMNAVDAFILHYHQYRYFEGVRFEGYLDSLMQEFTVFDRVTQANLWQNLDFDPAAMRAELVRLKKIPKRERTPDDVASLREANATKAKLKQLRTDPNRIAKFWPDSILPAETGMRAG